VIRTGNPHDTDLWEWWCGFYPGSHPARAPERHRRHLRPGPRRLRGRVARVPVEPDEADFQAWRDERDWTARKYALWDAGNRLPANEWEPGKPCKIYLKCPCGEIFNGERLEGTVIRVPHITAAATLH
jgi:hypothetical protein